MMMTMMMIMKRIRMMMITRMMMLRRMMIGGMSPAMRGWQESAKML